MKTWKIAGLFLALAVSVAAEDAKPLFENNFESAEVGQVPDGMLVLDGAFAVKSDGTNKFMELPGVPLETYGVIFGPGRKEDVSVSARINSTSKGRRAPTFGVGLDGQSGYKLQYSGGKKTLEIFHGETSVTNVPFEWKSGEWTMLRLQIRKAGDVWKVEGKAWQGATEPAAMTITYDEKTEPTSGRASIWGLPFATTAIQFDDLVVRAVGVSK